MATYTPTAATFYITSSWEVSYTYSQGYYISSGPTTGVETVAYSLSAIPQGSIINSATLYGTYSSPSSGTAIRTYSTNGGTTNYGFSGTANIKAAVQEQVNAGQSSISIHYRFKAKGRAYSPQGTKKFTSEYKNNKIVIDYSLPYSACSAPTVVSVPTNVAPETTQTLSWSGAKAGTGNAITGYQVYRQQTGNGTYYKFGSKITTTATSGSLSVTSHDTNGYYYHYKVMTIGTVSGYDSPQSSVVGSMRTYWTNPTQPDVLSATPSIFEDSTTLSWSGDSDGTNNAITGYIVDYRTSTDGGSTWSEAVQVTSSTRSFLLDTSSIQRETILQFRVKANGTISGSDSAYSSYSQSFSKNNMPLAPIIIFGKDGKRTYNTRPYIKVSIPAEPDGQALTVQAKIDSGDWQNVTTAPGTGGTKIGQLGELSVGERTVSIRLVDSVGVASDAVSITINVAAANFTDTIASMTPVKAVHMNELRQKIDNLRQYYGLSTVDWGEQIVAGVTTVKASHFAAIRTRLLEIAQVVGVTLVLPSPAKNTRITAAVINQYRNALVML